jgi:hypothetical protein
LVSEGWDIVGGGRLHFGVVFLVRVRGRQFGLCVYRP